MTWQTTPPPPDERLLIVVTFPETPKKILIGYYDEYRQQWRWEAGAISGTVTHWQQLPDFPAAPPPGY